MNIEITYEGLPLTYINTMLGDGKLTPEQADEIVDMMNGMDLD